MLHHRFAVIVLFWIAFTSVEAGAQMKPNITILNKRDSTVEMIPAEQAHRSDLPPALTSQLTAVPVGSFVLKNHRDKAITGMVVLWTFTDADGNTQKHKYISDGYYIPGDRAIIKPLATCLVTPSGRASEERFQQLAATGALDPIVGSKADHNRLTAVTIVVDSLIYEDGQIWGPDTLKYYLTIMNRRSVLEGLSTEMKEAKTGGESFKSHLDGIRKESSAANQRTKLRHDYARLLQISDDPEAALVRLQAQAALPDFHHIGGENQ